MTAVHPTAIVDADAEIAEDVEVGPYAVVGPRVRVGAGTRVGSHAVIAGTTTLGRDNRIFSHAVVGSPPQDKKFRGEDVILEIGDGNTIREFVTVNPGTEGGGGRTVLGDGNLLMAYVHVAHDCLVRDDCVFSNGAQLAGHVVVEDGVIVGGMSGVHQFVRVGTGAMIGGGSMAALDVPPFCIVSGNRATLHGLNLVGLKRSGMPVADIDALKEAFRIVFRQQLPLKTAIEHLDERFPDDGPVRTLATFLRESERGVARPGRDRSNGR